MGISGGGKNPEKKKGLPPISLREEKGSSAFDGSGGQMGTSVQEFRLTRGEREAEASLIGGEGGDGTKGGRKGFAVRGKELRNQGGPHASEGRQEAKKS